MSNVISPTSKMLTLVKREWQEQRILFFYLPLFMTLLAVVAFAVAAIRAYTLDIPFIGLIGQTPMVLEPPGTEDFLQGFAMQSMEVKASYWNQYYGQTIPLVFISYWGAMFYYFQMTLYSQRKDRSILFWNSLPVSNTETIFSKLVSGYCVAFVIYMICVLLLQLSNLLVLLMYGAMFDVPLWDTFIAPSGIVGRFFTMVGYGVVALFWCLPGYAWFLMTTAWAKSAPFAWAMAPLAIITVGELIFFGSVNSTGKIFQHMLPFGIFDTNAAIPDSIAARYINSEMLIGVLLGAAFIYGSIRLNRSEDG